MEIEQICGSKIIDSIKTIDNKAYKTYEFYIDFSIKGYKNIFRAYYEPINPLEEYKKIEDYTLRKIQIAEGSMLNGELHKVIKNKNEIKDEILKLSRFNLSNELKKIKKPKLIINS